MGPVQQPPRPSPVRPGAEVPPETTHMNDFIFIGLSVAFFVLAAAYVKFCDRAR